jgi:hypothetical protein
MGTEFMHVQTRPGPRDFQFCPKGSHGEPGSPERGGGKLDLSASASCIIMEYVEMH